MVDCSCSLLLSLVEWCKDNKTYVSPAKALATETCDFVTENHLLFQPGISSVAIFDKLFSN